MKRKKKYVCIYAILPQLHNWKYVLIVCNDARVETICERPYLATYVLYLCRRGMLNVCNKLPLISSQTILTKAKWSKEKSSKPPEIVTPLLTWERMLFHINKEGEIALVSNQKLRHAKTKRTQQQNNTGYAWILKPCWHLAWDRLGIACNGLKFKFNYKLVWEESSRITELKI